MRATAARCFRPVLEGLAWLDLRLRPRDCDPERDWDVLIRARCLIALLSCVPVLVAAFFVANRMIGKPLDPVEQSAFLGALAFPLILPLIRRGRVCLAANLAVGIATLLALGATASSGGQATLPLLVAVGIPLLAVCLAGISSGLAWTLVTGLTLTGLWAAVDAGVQFPRALSDSIQLRHRFVAPLLQLLLLMLIGMFYEHFRRRARDEVEESLERLARGDRQFRAVFGEASVGIALMRPDGELLGLNRFGAEFLPIEPGDDLIECLREWSEAGAESEESGPALDVLDLLEKGNHELQLRGRSGEQEWVSGSLSYVRDDSDRVELGVVVLRRVTEQKRVAEQMRRMAYFDPLTGLPNRAFFWERLNSAAESARREGHSVGLIFLDLDGFKEVNDRHGHEAGDAVLAETASRLKQSLRGTDEVLGSRPMEEWDGVSRLGGDEFTVLLSKVDGREGARVACQRILSALEGPIDFHGVELHVRASLGIALLPENSEDQEELLRLADQAMYEAKREGRQGFHFA